MGQLVVSVCPAVAMGPAVMKLEGPKWPVIVKLLPWKAANLAALIWVLMEVESL